MSEERRAEDGEEKTEDRKGAEASGACVARAARAGENAAIEQCCSLRTFAGRPGGLRRGGGRGELTAMNDLPPLPSEPKPGLYRHYKGKEYRVLGLARHSETLEPLVVYQALYGERGTWVRPAAMWSEIVELDGRRVVRFARMGD